MRMVVMAIRLSDLEFPSRDEWSRGLLIPARSVPAVPRRDGTKKRPPSQAGAFSA